MKGTTSKHDILHNFDVWMGDLSQDGKCQYKESLSCRFGLEHKYNLHGQLETFVRIKRQVANEKIVILSVGILDLEDLSNRPAFLLALQ